MELVSDVLQVEGFIIHDSADLHEIRHGLVGNYYRITGRFIPEKMDVPVLPHSSKKVVQKGFCRVDKT